MKTTKSIRNLLKREKIILFSAATVVFCLLSIMVPQARDLDKMNSKQEMEHLLTLVEVETESVMQVESWMLDF